MGLLDNLVSSLGASRPKAVPADDEPNSICAPASGRVLPLNEVKDPVFAMGMLGQGLAIEPDDDVAYAPVTGVITAVVGSRHALAIKADTGAEVLLHVGVDTVSLRGRGFKTFVAKGDRVRAGDPLIVFDRRIIEGAGLDSTVIVTITNPDEFAEVKQALDAPCDVHAGDPILLLAA